MEGWFCSKFTWVSSIWFSWKLFWVSDLCLSGRCGFGLGGCDTYGIVGAALTSKPQARTPGPCRLGSERLDGTSTKLENFSRAPANWCVIGQPHRGNSIHSIQQDRVPGKSTSDFPEMSIWLPLIEEVWHTALHAKLQVPKTKVPTAPDDPGDGWKTLDLNLAKKPCLTTAQGRGFWRRTGPCSRCPGSYAAIDLDPRPKIMICRNRWADALPSCLFRFHDNCRWPDNRLHRCGQHLQGYIAGRLPGTDATADCVCT